MKPTQKGNLNHGSGRLLISAFGIHIGGGLILLRALLRAASSDTRAILVDRRISSTETLNLNAAQVFPVSRSFRARIAGLRNLAASAQSSDVLLCFNGLPPLRRSRAYVVNYVQAPHFAGFHAGIRYSLITRFRILIERFWFRIGVRNCDEIWVQTESMAAAIRRENPTSCVCVAPLVDDLLFDGLTSNPTFSSRADHSRFSFFYPADGVGHKNHRQLLAAWKLLSEAGLTPQLILTLQDHEWAEIRVTEGIDMAGLSAVENIGRVSREEVLSRLRTSSALIFPSRAETLGLPLLEARMLGIPILASERDFVRDVCIPQETFDPESATSIALAVRRFMGETSMPSMQFYSAPKFVSKLLSCAC